MNKILFYNKSISCLYVFLAHVLETRYGNQWFITDLTVASPVGLILIQINPVNTEK